jgi:tetratricopeptide (TPR) repeat protein
VIPFEPTSAEAPHITGKATLNGKPIKVMFDTGASRSFLTDLAANRAGVRRDAAGVTDAGLAVGIAGGGVESWVAPFDSFELGDEKIRNTRIWVGKSAFDIDMLLGADFFLSHRVLVSHSQHRLYFTYSGGPVFRLDQAGANRAAATGETAGTTPTTQAAIPDDADALSRRGSASMARRDYAGAAADFGRAIALKPNDPQPYVDRARARLATGDRRAALDDLNHALKLKPDHVEALLQRGALHAGEDGEDAAAETDFAAAAKAAPDDARLPLRIAATWTGESRWDKATSWYGVWLAAHPKDPGRWDVLNNRCWARAMWGHELEQALEDCDAAVRLSERSANSLDSRGLVRLRLGKLKEAVADYDAALRKQPKLEWSLYGRGLARKRLGDVAGGEADLKAALKLEPDLAERAKGIGLVP